MQAVSRCVEDAPHDDAIGKHVVVVIVPLAGEARSRRAFEDERYTIAPGHGDHSNFAGSKSVRVLKVSVRLSSSVSRLMRPSVQFRIVFIGSGML
jgi:hypothetical protein